MYIEDLLKAAWYGVNVLTESLWWETAWKLRKIAEEQKLLSLSSGKDYDMEGVADELLNDDRKNWIKCGRKRGIHNVALLGVEDVEKNERLKRKVSEECAECAKEYLSSEQMQKC